MDGLKDYSSVYITVSLHNLQIPKCKIEKENTHKKTAGQPGPSGHFKVVRDRADCARARYVSLQARAAAAREVALCFTLNSLPLIGKGNFSYSKSGRDTKHGKGKLE